MKSIVSAEEIKKGKVTDVYFERTRQILEARNIHKTVTAEFAAKSLPDDYEWAVLAGMNEALQLLEDLPVDVESLPEGSLFRAEEPVFTITGDYLDFGVYETSILGYLCQASGIATRAARCRKAAGNKPVISFGARRMHPALAPVIERNAYIGGCDGVATVAAADYLGQEPVGTIPHALILIMGDTVEATRAFDEVIAPEVNRVSLVDTFGDEKFESLRVAEALGENLFAVRLDTPGSRRGDMLKIMKEVRWELDLNGYENVKLFLSGGLDEYAIHKYDPLADAYGVGTSVSAAPVIDFAMDIVDIEGTPLAKRGKQAARKSLWRCNDCFTHVTTLRKPQDQAPVCPECGQSTELILRPVENKTGAIEKFGDHDSVREYVLDQLNHVSIDLTP